MDDRIIQIAKRTLEVGGKILIVGATHGNLGKWHDLNDPRLVVWPSTSRRTARRAVPGDVGLVIMTRFWDHSTNKWLRNSLPRTATFYSKHVSTGELKDFLETVYTPPQPRQEIAPVVFRQQVVVLKPVMPVASPIVVAEVEEKKMGEEKVVVSASSKEKGDVVNFVRSNADFDTKSPSIELARLEALASEKGVPTTRASLANCFYKERKRQRGAASATTPRRRDSNELLKEFTGSCELVRVAVVEILEENKKLQEEVRQLKAALVGQKQAIKKALSQL